MKTWDQLTAKRRSDPGYEKRMARHRADALDEIHEFHLAEVRRIAEFTQMELALRMGADQSRVSRVEAGTDIRLSTLRAYVEALGGELKVYAELPGQEPLPLAI